MKRLALCILACLIAPPSAIFGAGYKTTPLESLPLVNSGSGNVAIIGPGHVGHYRDQVINRGIQFGNTCGGFGQEAKAEFNLHGKYDDLSGTIYNEASNTDEVAPVTIYDTGDPNHKRPLYNATLPGLGEAHFSISVHGLGYILIYEPGGSSCGGVDIVATLTSGTAPPTQVLLRFPTGNAGVPAEGNVLFGWQPFPHATNYAFHIWLVGLSGSVPLSPTTPFSFSASIYHKTTYTWNDHGFLPGTYQYSLLPLDDSGHNLAGWSTPTQITIASS